MRTVAALPALLALAHAGPAQELATTLDALSRGGSPVVRVRVLSSRADSGRVRVRVAVAERLRGAAPDELLLEEPAGRACGRALHGVVPGAGYVAFLDDSGRALAAASSRALVALEPGLVDHVRALLAAADPQRVEILASALEHVSSRVRDDAAMALQIAPGVEGASAVARRGILAALARALPSADRPVPSLCVAAVRTADPAVADLLVPFYLRGDRRDLDRVVGRALRGLDGRLVAHRIPASLGGATARRAVELARLLAPSDAVPVLSALARSEDAAVRIDALAGLLGLGLRVDELPRLGATPDEVIEARRRSSDAPRFRSIEPGRIR